MATPDAVSPLRQNRRVLAAAMVGTTVEYYDFFIYGTAAALVFGPLFFPSESAAAQTLLSFMSFGIAFIARPIGAIAFGHFGDKVGRKSTLVASLLLMGGCTLAIAFLPTYDQMARYGPGWIAPTLLCLMRFGQGFGLGGEWGGAALLAVENAPKGWEARFVSIMQMGSSLGFFAANGIFLLIGVTLSEADFLRWGWRLPFLASALLVILGLWIRLKISETPAFKAALERAPPPKVPLAEVLSSHGRALLAGSAGVVVIFAAFYLTTAYALSQAVTSLGYPRQLFLGIQMGASLMYALGIMLGGMVADRTSAGKMMAVTALGMVLAGMVFGAGLGAGLGFAAVTLCVTMFTLGIGNGPQGAWLARLYPVRIRYSAISLAFNVGGIVGGALTPIAAQWLSSQGAAIYGGLLLSVAGLIAFAGVMLSRPVSD